MQRERVKSELLGDFSNSGYTQLIRGFVQAASIIAARRSKSIFGRGILDNTTSLIRRMYSFTLKRRVSNT